jgi:hypothetical protein
MTPIITAKTPIDDDDASLIALPVLGLEFAVPVAAPMGPVSVEV